MKTEIKVLPFVKNNTEINRRNRVAQAYIDSHKKCKANKEDIGFALCILFALITFIVAIIVKANLDTVPYQEGYYKQTETTQNGNHYVYVSERICTVTDIVADYVTVYYNGNYYSFFGTGYVKGQTIVCQFTNDMKIIGVTE